MGMENLEKFFDIWWESFGGKGCDFGGICITIINYYDTH